MSTAQMTTDSGSSWSLWLAQIGAVMRLEVRKNLLGKRSLLLYVLAAMPLFPIGMLLLVSALHELPDGIKDFGATMMFASVVFQGFILSFSMYLGCVWIFMNLFRGEELDRSLHYYFLTPIKREVLVAGKFMSGWATAFILFGGVTLVSFLMLHAAFGLEQVQRHLFSGPGLSQLLAYLAIVALGCLGYGAVFLLVGLFFKNPIVPAILIWGWEAINYLLPPALKKVSVIHYLSSLTPVKISDGPLAILAEPTPAWISVPGLLIFCAVILALSGWRIRYKEVQYSSD